MAKQINISADGKDYTLTFTRNTVKQMERNGFVIDDMSTKPMTTLPALFAGAFIARHPNAKRSDVDRIYDKLGDKRGLISALTDMYLETLETLLDTPESEGNVIWTPNWEIEE